MKKIIKLVFITMLFSLVLISKVNAGACDNRPYECIECNYDRFSYVVYADGTGDAEIDRSASKKLTLATANKIIDEVTGPDFVNEDGDALSCPIIYQEYVEDSMLDSQDPHDFILYATWEVPNGSVLKKDKIYEAVSSSSNGKPFLGNEDEDEKAKKTCLFINSDTSRKVYIRITYDGNDLSYDVTPERYEVVVPNGNTLNEIKEQFKKDCEDIEIYTFVMDAASEMMDVTQVFISTKPNSASGENKMKAMDNISDHKVITGYQTKKNDFTPRKLCEVGECDIDVSNFCDETSVISVLRFIGILLFIAKVLVPLIIIGMGIYHLFMIITAGKPEEAKKQVNSIIKRVIVGVIIFLLPSFVYWIFQVAGASESGYSNCVNCILDLGNCSTK